MTIQEAAEAHLHKLLKVADIMKRHAGRETLMLRDMKAAKLILEVSASKNLVTVLFSLNYLVLNYSQLTVIRKSL